MCHLSCVIRHVSPVMYHLSCITCHVSPVICHLSSVTCHRSPFVHHKFFCVSCHSHLQDMDSAYSNLKFDPHCICLHICNTHHLKIDKNFLWYISKYVSNLCFCYFRMHLVALGYSWLHLVALSEITWHHMTTADKNRYAIYEQKKIIFCYGFFFIQIQIQYIPVPFLQKIKKTQICLGWHKRANTNTNIQTDIANIKKTYGYT